MANQNYWLNAINNKNKTAEFNPFAGKKMPNLSGNAFLLSQINRGQSPTPTPAPAPSVVSPSATKASTPQNNISARLGAVPQPMSNNKATLYGPGGEQKVVDVGSRDASQLQAGGWGLTPGSYSGIDITKNNNYNPIQAPTSPVVAPAATGYSTNDKAYKDAALAYIASLAPSSDVASAKQKYADFVASSNLGNEALQGQGRGIPLALVRGQQAKLYNQSQIEAKRLQGEIDLAQGQQTAAQSQGLAKMNLEQGLLNANKTTNSEAAKFQNDLVKAGYVPYTGQSGVQNVQSFTDPTGKVVQYVAPAAKPEKTATPTTKVVGKTLYQYDAESNTWNPAITGQPASAMVNSSSTTPTPAPLSSEQKKIQTKVDAELSKLAKGGSWGDSWNYLKNLYPDIPNEVLDAALRKDQYYPKETSSSSGGKSWYEFWR